MIGIDITKISRFKDATNAFIEKILHPEEIKQLETTENKPKFLATRWAIKEALFKTDNANFSFSKINIQKSDGKYILNGYNISTSNEEDFVIAMVLKEKNE